MRPYIFTTAIVSLLISATPALAYDGSGSFVSQGVTRSFVYHAPGTTVPEGLPLIIAFHGTGGTGAGFKAYSGLDAQADASNLIVVYPNSTTIGGDLQWNVYADDQPGHGGVGDANATDDVQFTRDLIDWFCTTHEIDPQRVYATGHSNGGFMTYQLALHLSDRIAAFAPVAGSLWGDNTYLTQAFGAGFVPVPIAHLHGDPDPVVEYPDADHDPNTWNWPLSSFGSATCGNDAYLPFPISPTIDQLVFCDGVVGEPVTLFRVQGVGHAWPSQGGFVAEAVIVNFLLNHSIADPGVVCGESNVAENGELAILSVFPIPARDQLQFNIAPQPGSRMQVSDARGRMLWQGAANGVRTLQLPNLSAGHYLLRVTPPQGRPFTLPFTVGE